MGAVDKTSSEEHDDAFCRFCLPRECSNASSFLCRGLNLIAWLLDANVLDARAGSEALSQFVRGNVCAERYRHLDGHDSRREPRFKFT